MAEEKLETKSENQINLENEEINFSDEKNIDIFAFADYSATYPSTGRVV